MRLTEGARLSPLTHVGIPLELYSAHAHKAGAHGSRQLPSVAAAICQMDWDLLQIGFQAHQYAGHSFRIGAATYSSLCVHGRLHDPDTRQVAQCGFPQVY